MTQPQSDTPDCEAELLLPWYATGQLDGDEHARVAAHLAGCASCREALRVERRMAEAVGDLAEPGEHGWEGMRARLTEAPVPLPPQVAPRPRVRSRRFDARAMRWTIAAQAAAIAALAFTAVLPTRRDEAPYRVLSDAPAAAAPAGNVLAMFRPEASEAALRALLRDAHARLVDGPTAANAYLLEVPGAERPAALARLRRDPLVTMAEPMDGPP